MCNIRDHQVGQLEISNDEEELVQMPDCGAAGDPEGRVLGVHHPAFGADVVDVQAGVGPGFLLN